jgi:hypothetical protein
VALDIFGGQTWSLHTPTRAPDVFSGSVRTFGRALPRLFLFGWHGSVVTPVSLAALTVCLSLSVVALLTLRPVAAPASRWLRAYGFAFFGCAVLLAPVSQYGPVPRLVGYGLLVLILSFRPRQWASGVWLAYGAAALITGTLNGMTVSTTGLNDLRYVALGTEFRAYYTGSATVATNARHILDLHAGVPSRTVRNWDLANDYSHLLWVTPPSDAGPPMFLELPRPGPEWCEEQRFTGAVLFTRCEAG